MRKIIVLLLVQCLIFVTIAFTMVFTTAFTIDSDHTSAQNVAEVEESLIYDGESVNERELRKVDYDGYIVKLKNDISNAEMRAIIDEIKALDNGSVESLENGFYSADSLETISQIVDADNIEYIEPDVKCELFGNFVSTPNDEYVTSSRTNWPWRKANTAGAWNLGIFGQNLNEDDPITVVVIDSGIASEHPDLDYNRIADGITYFNGDEYEGTEDYLGHGTFVSGVINATMNNGIGVSGSMPGLEVYPIRVYNRTSSGTISGGNISDIIRGINRAATIKADVVNMSLGTKSYVKSLNTACKEATDKDLILVASAGNDGDATVNYPAGCDGVISVGSVTEFVVKASSSNYNSFVDATAPGHGVMGLTLGTPGDNTSYYKRGYGTSFAAPMVAALAGMAKSIDRDITAPEFEQLLAATSRDMGIEGKDEYYGYGVIDFGKMAQKMLDDKKSISDNPGNENNGSEEIEDPSIPEDPVDNRIDISKVASIKVGQTYTYTGSAIRPKVTVTNVPSEGYTVSYKSNKNVGKATVTITGKGNYQGSLSATFKIRPKGTSISSLAKSGTSLTVKWKKQNTKMSTSRISGYQVQIATNSAFSKGKKSSTVSKHSTVSKKFKSLKKGKVYYVRARTYKTVSGTKYYSAWSSIKKKKM